MKNTISIFGNELTVNEGVPVAFEEDIYEIVDMESVVVVLTMPEHGAMTENRVYGVIDGKIAWRVQDMTEYHPNYAVVAPDPYVSIRHYKDDPGLLVGTTGYGFRMLINPNNGKIVGKDGWCR
ncbi:MAG: hypothetical protein RSC86_03750 [Oscillospiraceae bacterium]